VRRKRRRVEPVEVKAVSGSEPTFIITHREVGRARSDPAFIPYFVTHALS
jgi:hypothetical protein